MGYGAGHMTKKIIIILAWHAFLYGMSFLRVAPLEVCLNEALEYVNCVTGYPQAY